MKDKLEVTQEEIDKAVAEARKKLDKTDLYGPYGHNIAGLVLSGLASKVGTKYANRLIFEYDLDELGIMPVKDK